MYRYREPPRNRDTALFSLGNFSHFAKTAHFLYFFNEGNLIFTSTSFAFPFHFVSHTHNTPKAKNLYYKLPHNKAIVVTGGGKAIRQRVMAFIVKVKYT